MDPEVADFLASSGPKPSQANLDELIRLTESIRISVRRTRESASDPASAPHEIVLTSADEIAAFKQCIRLASDQYGCHLMTFGWARVQFHGLGQMLDAMDILCGATCLRWDAWHGDAQLADDSLLHWFAARGCPELLADREESRLRHAKKQERTAAWNACIPEPLRSATERLCEHPEEGIARLKQAAEEAYPDPHVRAAVLLRWVGGVEPLYSGYTSTESYPLELLLTLPPATVVDSLRPLPEGSPEWRGAVRHYLSWGMQKKRRRAEVRGLPPEIKTILRSTALQCEDTTYHGRAERVWPS